MIPLREKMIKAMPLRGLAESLFPTVCGNGLAAN